MPRSSTVWAPINIAVLKYWGKKDAAANIPLNDSISVTLDGAHGRLGTRTSVTMDVSPQDLFEVTINGVDYSASVRPKAQKILDALRRSIGDTNSYHVKVESNNFSPTAAGLASSASGYAALTAAIAKCLEYEGDLSSIARLGSGSATRSIHGGVVKWKTTPSQSCALQLATEDHWPELGCFIVRLGYLEKAVSSTVGMKHSVDTSQLLKYRVSERVMEEKIREFQEAILAKDFEQFAMLTMKDSNQFHAICLDTHPPINYLRPESWAVIDAVHEMNEEFGRIVCGYTFDAGPHPVLFFLKGDKMTVQTKIEGLALQNATIIECNVSTGVEYY